MSKSLWDHADDGEGALDRRAVVQRRSGDAKACLQTRL
jgi:hypothetical protein